MGVWCLLEKAVYDILAESLGRERLGDGGKEKRRIWREEDCMSISAALVVSVRGLSLSRPVPRYGSKHLTTTSSACRIIKTRHIYEVLIPQMELD